MTVCFKVSIAGSDFSYRPGEVALITDSLAEAWSASGVCDILASQQKIAAPKPKTFKKDKE
jgi:hypothetical protein